MKEMIFEKCYDNPDKIHKIVCMCAFTKINDNHKKRREKRDDDDDDDNEKFKCNVNSRKVNNPQPLKGSDCVVFFTLIPSLSRLGNFEPKLRTSKKNHV